jgi:hypothetical protein
MADNRSQGLSELVNPVQRDLQRAEAHLIKHYGLDHGYHKQIYEIKSLLEQAQNSDSTDEINRQLNEAKKRIEQLHDEISLIHRLKNKLQQLTRL